MPACTVSSSTAWARRSYSFMLDFNFNHVPDAKIPYGAPGDVPLVGNMSPGGKTSLIVYRNGAWNIDTNRDGTTKIPSSPSAGCQATFR